MASISNSSITFLNYSYYESVSNIRLDLLRHLICDRYTYYADDDVAHCYAALDYTGSIGLSDLTITLKTADLVTTYDTEVYFSVSSNRVEWTIDISDLPVGTYVVTAQLSTSGTAQTFTFKKNNKTVHDITYPTDGIEIFPMDQDYLANVTYPMHAAVPLPIGIAVAGDSFRLYENDVLIASQVEVVGVWDKNNAPKWLHVYFNATYVAGVAKTYILKKASSPANPVTSLTVTDDTPILTVSADSSTNLWTTSSNHHWTTGQPIKFRTTGVLPKIVTPIYPLVFDTAIIYYARISSDTTFTVHPTERDAWENTEVIDVLNSGSGTHSVFTVSSWYVAAANLGAIFGISDPDTWVTSGPHNLTTGNKVVYSIPPGTNSNSVDTYLDENKIYTVSVVNSTQFILFYNGNQVDVVPSDGYRNFHVVTTITVANNKIKYEILRPFAGISTAWFDPTGTGNYGSPIADAGILVSSGPTLTDNRGITWESKRDYFGQVMVEQNGINQICVRAEGWYDHNDKAITPFCRHVTRIYAFAAQPLIRVEFGTIIADNTYQAKIGDLSFNLPLNTGGIVTYGVDESTINDNHFTISSVNTGTNAITTTLNHDWVTGQAVKIAISTGSVPVPLLENTTYYARVLTANSISMHPTLLDATNATNTIDITTSGAGTLYVYEADNPAYFHQERKNTCRYLGSTTGVGQKSDGWFNIEGKNIRTTLFARDFWQKFPKEVELSGNGVLYHSWPKHGRRTYTTAEELAATDIYNFGCFQQGKYLDLQLPIEYYETLLNSSEANAEGLPRYALAAYADGASIQNDFTFMFSAVSSSVDKLNWAKLIQDHPIALPSSQWCCESQVMGKIAPPDETNYAQVEEFIENSFTPFFNADAIDSYGQFNYGDGHHTWLVNEDRSSLHRTWYNNHYFSTTQGWLLFLRGQKRKMLNTVRPQTNHTACIDFIRWEERRGYRIGQGNRIEVASQVQWHDLGSFYHCKGQVHWGAPGWGDSGDDSYSGPSGHWVDASGQLQSWLIDANRWSKDTYEVWYRGLRTRSAMLPTTPGREQKGAWYGAFWAYKHFMDPALFPYLIGQLKGWEGTSSGFETGMGNLIPAFSTTATNATDSTGTWTKNSIVWTISEPLYGYSRAKMKWETPELVRFTTTGTLPAPLSIYKQYWANVSSRVTNLVFTLYEYEDFQDCMDRADNFITYTDTGSGVHTVYSGTIQDTTASPLANGGLYSQWWWEQWRDPAFPQWVKDNNSDKFVESVPNIIIAGLVYEQTGNVYELEKWLPTIHYFTDHRLYRDVNSPYDYWGSGPGASNGGDRWFSPQWPYFLYHLKNTNIVIQPDGTNGNDDTYLNSDNPSTNYGNSPTLLLGYDEDDNGKTVDERYYRAMFKFNLESLVGQTVNNATLTLTVINFATHQTFGVHRITQPNWTELGATWNKYDGITNWDTAGGDRSSEMASTIWSGESEIVFNMNTLVADALENRDGILTCIISGDATTEGSQIQVASFEHTNESYRPKLTLEVEALANSGFQGREEIGQYLTGQSRYTNGLDNNRGATVMILHDSANGDIEMKARSFAIGNPNIQGGTLFIGLNPNTRLHGLFGEAAYVPGEPGTMQINPPVWSVTSDGIAYQPSDTAQVRYEESGQPLVYIQRMISWADNEDGLYKMQFNGSAHGVLLGVSNQNELEACVMHNYHINQWPIPTPSYADNAWSATYISKGYLMSLVSNPVSIEIVSGYSSTSGNLPVYVYIEDSNGTIIADDYILAGETSDTLTYLMNDPNNYHPEPWYIKIIPNPYNWAIINFKVLDPNTLVEINDYDLNDAAVFGETQEDIMAIALHLTGTHTMSGGLTLGGASAASATSFNVAATGGLTLAGDATTISSFGEYHYTATGGFIMGGTLGIAGYQYAYTGTGGFSLIGIAQTVNSEDSRIGANPDGDRKRSCVQAGNWWCPELKLCSDSITYRDALIPAIVVCIADREVTRSVQEEEVITTS